ncbi:hypothetical protein GALL_471330 [mine drainage metagenome]|uniref:Uncharacterized protein n=1 Tax=mine drainage metagenome TaxID=410659 RepID=A0A1J5Q184_9ZZZZ
MQFGDFVRPFILIGFAIHLQTLGANDDQVLVPDFIFFLPLGYHHPFTTWAGTWPAATSTAALADFLGFAVVDAGVVKPGDVANKVVNPELSFTNLWANTTTPSTHLCVFHG